MNITCFKSGWRLAAQPPDKGKQRPPRRRPARGLRAEDVRRLLLRLPGISRGRVYGHPSFLVNGEFFARFRDDDTVLVLRLASIDDRDVLMQLDSRVFFYTEHYRNYATVLIRLSEVTRALLQGVVRESWRHVSGVPQKPRPTLRRGRQRGSPAT